MPHRILVREDFFSDEDRYPTQAAEFAAKLDELEADGWTLVNIVQQHTQLQSEGNNLVQRVDAGPYLIFHRPD